MAKYLTKQRRALLDFFTEHTDEFFSAKEIAEKLEAQDISVSAVYRNLSELAAEGKLKRISREGSREAFYQFTDAEDCRDKLHLICKSCGKTVHLGSEDTEKLASQLSSHKHFTLDRAETVLYGTCQSCSEEDT